MAPGFPKRPISPRLELPGGCSNHKEDEMGSPIASRFVLRVLMTILISISASTVFGQENHAGVSATARRSPAPAWGTQDSSVLTRMAADFGSMDDSQDTVIANGFSFAFNLRACLVEGLFGYPGCWLQSGVSLPSGAVIEYMELAACDDDFEFGVTASLYVWEGLQGFAPPVASIATQGDSGCLFYTTGYIGVTVDNLANNYAVIVELPQADVAFRSVRIFYSLQVSPAPAFASFNDIPVGSTYHRYVEALFASGITAGCGGGNFCPNGTLTRGQMAIFLAKALGLHFPN
jgi:hypothetical protein